MTQKINLLDLVALTQAMPSKGLRQGQVGTVVEVLADGVYEVEFCDRQGRTLAMLPVKAAMLLLLQYELAAA